MGSIQQENVIVPLSGSGSSADAQIPFDFCRDIADCVNPAVYNNSTSILTRCTHKYIRVVQRHCLENGVNFITTNDTVTHKFLRQDALERALKEANEESMNFLHSYMSLSAPADQEVINKLKRWTTDTDDRLKEIHENLQREFIKTLKNQVWKDFLDRMAVTYGYLFMDNSDSCFYNQERMHNLISEMIKEAKQDLLRESRLGSFDSDSGLVSLIDEIQKSGELMLAINIKHKENCKHHLEHLIHTEFKESGSRELEETIHENPFLFSTEEHLRHAVIDNLKSHYLAVINAYLRDNCLEDLETFQEIYVADLEGRSEKLVKHGMIMLERRDANWNKCSQGMEPSLSKAIKKLCKDNLMPDTVRVYVQKVLKETFIKEITKDGFTSNFSKTLASPSAVTTSLQLVATQGQGTNPTTDSDSTVTTVAPSPTVKHSRLRTNSSGGAEAIPSKRPKDMHDSSLPFMPAQPVRDQASVNSNTTSNGQHPQSNGNSKQNQQSGDRKGRKSKGV